jgi:hypothetical protein
MLGDNALVKSLRLNVCVCWKFLNYVGDRETDNLFGFCRLYMGIFKKPFSNLLALVRVTGETSCFFIPVRAVRAGNF